MPYIDANELWPHHTDSVTTMIFQPYLIIFHLFRNIPAKLMWYMVNRKGHCDSVVDRLILFMSVFPQLLQLPLYRNPTFHYPGHISIESDIDTVDWVMCGVLRYQCKRLPVFITLYSHGWYHSHGANQTVNASYGRRRMFFLHSKFALRYTTKNNQIKFLSNYLSKVF